MYKRKLYFFAISFAGALIITLIATTISAHFTRQNLEQSTVARWHDYPSALSSGATFSALISGLPVTKQQIFSCRCHCAIRSVNAASPNRAA